MTDSFPPTTQVLPSRPHITLYVDGLSVLCINKEKKRAEIGFLSLADHDVQMSVFESGKKSAIVRDSMITTRENRLGSVTSGTVECFEKDKQPENFSWMLDLSALYGEGVEFKQAELRTRFYIENAVVSTAPDSLIEVTPYDQKNPAHQKPAITIGRVLKVMTKSADAFLKIGNRKLDLDPKKQYCVVLRTGGCKADAQDGDFKHVFKILKNAGNVQYNLRYGKGQFPWLAPCELSEAQYLGQSLERFVNKTDSTDKVRAELYERLEFLTKRFRCPPAPCMLSAIGKKSLTLPKL